MTEGHSTDTTTNGETATDGGTVRDSETATDGGTVTDDADDVLLRAEGLKKYYTTQDSFLDRLLGDVQQVKAVDGVDLEIKEGETLGLVGESGCGKSSLGRSLLRLEEVTEGAVYYDGVDLTELSNSEMRDKRRDIQYIFQNPFASLNPRLTIKDIVGEALDVHDLVDSETERDARVKELLEIVGLSSSHASRYPHEFSGGQRQRIGIARALAVEPDLIICDEPVSALDVSVQAQILNLLDELQDEFGLSYLFIAHDLSVVEHIADRIAVMYLGHIVELGTPDEVFEPPSHPYTNALLSAIPEPDPLWEGDRIILEGNVPSPINPPSGCTFHTRCPQVIQPENYEFEQSTWRSVMTFRQRVAGESISHASVVETATGISDRETATDDEVARALRAQQGIPEELSDPDAEAVLSEAITSVLADDLEGAAELLAAEFTTPCEEVTPELIETRQGHEIACLLYDDEYPDGEGAAFIDHD